jgi:hypothetical protein
VALVVNALALVVSAPALGGVPPSYPFAPPDGLRAAGPRDGLPDLWADGAPCATGCYPQGALPGWPMRPFHRPHLLNAGLNERRPASLHSGVDIVARDGTPVFAVQAGSAHLIATRGPDARLQIGQFVYWHIRARVREGQQVSAYGEVVGTVLEGAGHLHLSEVSGDRYLNPLRPGGRVLSPWLDTAAPVVGRPRFKRGGRVLIRGFDPQSTRRRGASTPVLGLAGLAYRVFDSHGRRVGPLQWALRGSRHLPDDKRRAIYAHGSHPAHAKCSSRLRRPCRPNWVYRLAGGLAPRISLGGRGVYTLTAYAWDWAGSVRALDTDVKLLGESLRVVRHRAIFRKRRGRRFEFVRPTGLREAGSHIAS